MELAFDKGRCIWTGRWTSEARPLSLDLGPDLRGRRHVVEVAVLPQHEADLLHFGERMRRLGRLFFAVMVACSVALLALMLLDDRRPLSLILITMGALFLGFPCTTPATWQIVGIRQGIVFVRVTGAAIATLALLLLAGLI